MKHIKIIFCLSVISYAQISLTMDGNCVHNSLTMKVKESNDEEQFEDSELGRAQKAIHQTFKQNLFMRNDLQVLHANYKKYKKLFTSEEQNNLSKKEEEIIAYLDEAQDAKNNANATINQNWVSNRHLKSANDSLTKVLPLLEQYKNTINARLEERLIKLNDKIESTRVKLDSKL